MARSVTKADGVEFTVAASSREIEVGEPLQVELTVLADDGADVTLPTFDEAMAPFEVRRSERPPPIPVNGKRQWRAQLALMTFEPGEIEIPPIEIEFRAPARDEDGVESQEERTARRLKSNPISIVARTVVGEDAERTAFRDIKGPAEMPTDPAWKWWVLGAGGAAMLAVLAVAALLLVRMRREPAVERPLLPHEWAMRELEIIERDGLIAQRAFEPFYVRVSDVVRGYLERRFGLMAPERTTDEFLRDAGRSSPSRIAFGDRLLRDEHRELLGDFLRAADMVKFARYEPAESDCRDALATARSFIKQTAPKQQISEGDSTGQAAHGQEVPA